MASLPGHILFFQAGLEPSCRALGGSLVWAHGNSVGLKSSRNPEVETGGIGVILDTARAELGETLRKQQEFSISGLSEAITLTFVVLYDLWRPVGDTYNFEVCRAWNSCSRAFLREGRRSQPLSSSEKYGRGCFQHVARPPSMLAPRVPKKRREILPMPWSLHWSNCSVYGMRPRAVSLLPGANPARGFAICDGSTSNLFRGATALGD